MKRLRRHLTSLATDTISPLNLPPVRWPLLTKLNLLTVGLIFLTAILTTGFYLSQNRQLDETEFERDLRAQGSTILAMLTEMSERGLSATDRARLDAVLDNLEADGDYAYVVVLGLNRDADPRATVRRFAAQRRPAGLRGRTLRSRRRVQSARPKSPSRDGATSSSLRAC